VTSVEGVRRARPGAAPAALGAAAVMGAAQIAVPLAGDRSGLTTVVVAAFAVTTTCLAAAVWGWVRAVVAAVAIVGATTAIERVGTTTGWPFGDYRYTGVLTPTVAGVPLAVGLAWWGMALPAREAAARLVRPGWPTVAVGALALTAWDVMLDPQAVDEGWWVWDAGGPWRGVPLSNYAGWLVVSAVVMAALDRLLPDPGQSLPLLGLYVWWAALSTLGFLVFFGDPVVGLAGAAAMLPFAALAVARARRMPAAGHG
jgi:uncharacterized membrane protein